MTWQPSRANAWFLVLPESWAFIGHWSGGCQQDSLGIGKWSRQLGLSAESGEEKSGEGSTCYINIYSLDIL